MIGGGSAATGSRLASGQGVGEAPARRRWSAVATVALVGVVLLSVVAVVLWWRRSVAGDAHGDARVRTTVLQQVVGPDDRALASVLLGHDQTRGTGAILLLPPRFGVDVPGSGRTVVADLPADPDEPAVRESLSGALGVTVDGTWRLDASSFAALVDQVGGVQVPVDVNVRERLPDGTARTVVPKGARQLDGVGAATFATYRAEGEPEDVVSRRFQAVLAAVLAKIPREPRQTEAIVEALGGGSSASLPSAPLATLLSGLRSSGPVPMQSLPVRTLNPNTKPPTYVVDPEKAGPVLRDYLGGVAAGE